VLLKLATMPLPRNRRPRSSKPPPRIKSRESTSAPQPDSDELPQADFDLSPSTHIPQLNTKRDLSIGSASTTSPGRDNLAWYICGKRAPDKVVHMAEHKFGWLNTVYDMMGKLGAVWPTTWEAVEASLQDEGEKPADERNIACEYAFFAIIGLKLGAKGAKMIMPNTKIQMPLRQGEGFIWPAVDCPPWMLDMERDKNERAQIVDEETGEEVEAVVIMTYFTAKSDIEKHPWDPASGEKLRYRRVDGSGKVTEKDCKSFYITRAAS